MDQPRQQYYNFAHRVLKQDAHTEPKLWSFITGDKADSYAQMRWHDAGEAAGENHPPDKLLWVAPIKEGDIEIVVLHTPPPQAMSETYFVAFVKTPQQSFPLRYFVCERSSTGGAYWAEWRPNMRLRGADVPEWPADNARKLALPMPYLGAFVEAILGEVKHSPSIVDVGPPVAAKPTEKKGMPTIVLAIILVLVAACVYPIIMAMMGAYR